MFMHADKIQIKNCAVYTRKSSEEGLEQDFNSLDAQGEACISYINSQKIEGWRAIERTYDDGGYSGGNMQRPGLKALLDDIRAGKIDIVVVYKIDRLTRSLTDFAKLVDVFDAHGVTFVSVTQSFNTTTSMGRLTLNVLLSFAQFEREVTSERIRDKIAASKKKGMWMGGPVPLGYKVINRKLIIDNAEAPSVRHIFDTYEQCKSVKTLKRLLNNQPKKFSRGQLYTFLRNPIYIGKIRHKDKLYDGQHEGIIDDAQFERVQKLITENRVRHTERNINSGSLLKGLLFDIGGNAYSPTYTNKSGKRYSYYISQNLLQDRQHPKHILGRLPAGEIEKHVKDAIYDFIYNSKNIELMFTGLQEKHIQYIKSNTAPLISTTIRKILKRAVLNSESIELHLCIKTLGDTLSKLYEIDCGAPITNDYTLQAAFKKKIVKDGAIVIEAQNGRVKDKLDLPPEQLKRIVCGIIWRDEHFDGTAMKDIAFNNGRSENYVRKCIYESFDFLSQ